MQVKVAVIYPNPAMDYINIELNNSQYTAQPEIFNAKVIKLLSKEIQESKRISTENYQSGFFFRVSHKDQSKVFKICVN